MGIWGTNFVFMRWAVDLVPPVTFATLRFATISLTLLLFVPRPAVPIQLLLGYGLFSFFAQFALLFGAIAEGTTTIEGLLPAEDPLSTAACLR
ncbi:MAG: hypothetical protein EBT14_04935, partial [Betaproteobacteria bacterium]|nr:hypothetical protein [Betaproteobacteria bacterium]